MILGDWESALRKLPEWRVWLGEFRSGGFGFRVGGGQSVYLIHAIYLLSVFRLINSINLMNLSHQVHLSHSITVVSLLT